MNDTFENKLQLGNGIYTTRDVAGVLRMSYAKASLWLSKYWEGELGSYYNNTYSWTVEKTKAIDFYTLVEMYIMSQMIEEGVKPKDVIRAHKEIVLEKGLDFPFVNEDVLKSISIGGKKIYFSDNHGTRNLDGTKQFNLDFIKDFFKKIDFDADKMVSRIWPMGKNHNIVCDPHHKFGQPTIHGTNIQAELIFGMYKAKEPMNYIASLYDLKISEVKDAIQFFKEVA
jgi:uncharacterized protein (DUF433 family)